MKTLIGIRIFVVMNEMRRFVKRRTSCRLIGLYKIETDRWYQICAAFLKRNNETAAWVTTRIISDIHTQFKILIYERTQYFATYSVWYNMTKRLCWVRSCAMSVSRTNWKIIHFFIYKAQSWTHFYLSLWKYIYLPICRL